MPSPLWFSVATALLTVGLLLQVLVLRAIHEDPVAVYRLFAVRDKLIRLVVERKVARDEPSFVALYSELNALLRSSRSISGPGGWPLAAVQGRSFARHSGADQPLRLAACPIPQSLQPVAAELRDALEHLLGNHHGVYVQISAKRREAERIRRKRAEALLESMAAMTGRCS